LVVFQLAVVTANLPCRAAANRLAEFHSCKKIVAENPLTYLPANSGRDPHLPVATTHFSRQASF